MTRSAQITEAAISAAILAALVASTPAQQVEFHQLEGGALPPTQEYALFHRLGAQALPKTPSRTFSVVLADLDGDSDLDLVSGNYGQWYRGGEQSRLYLNDGRGSYTDATTTRLPAGAYHTREVVVGDVDGDRDLDLVLGNQGEPNRLYLNDGSATFTDVTATHLPTAGSNGTRAAALGDVDGDGDLDLVLVYALYLNDGTGIFTDATAGKLPPITPHFWVTRLALGDVDGDGDLDLVVAGTERLFLNDGTGTFVDATPGRLPPVSGPPANDLALGDVDGDGDLDLVLGTGLLAYMVFAGQDRLYLNDGSATFTDVTAGRLPQIMDHTRGVALGDVDGDGDLDLVTADGYDYHAPYGGSEIEGGPDAERLFLNDGNGSFSDETRRIPSTPYDFTNAVALGDVDGDGDLDLVAGNYAQPSRLYFNLLRQLDTPASPRIGQTYAIDAYARSASASVPEVAYPFLAVASGSFPTAFGTFGLGPPIISLPPIAIPQPQGLGSLSLAIPNDQLLVGIPLYAQALIIGRGAMRLTNVTADIIVQ